MKEIEKEGEIRNAVDLAIVIIAAEVSNAGKKYCDFKVQLETQTKQILRWTYFRRKSDVESFITFFKAQPKSVRSEGQHQGAIFSAKAESSK